MRYNDAVSKARQIFGDRIPKEFTDLCEKLEKAKEALREAEAGNVVRPYHHANIACAKASLFDLLNSEGSVIIGFVSYDNRSI